MKIAIYTAIFGNKDLLKTPIFYQKSDTIDYYVITDNNELVCKGYQLVYKEAIFDDVTKNARFYKIKGLSVFEEYDYSIWHDANIQINHKYIPNIVNYAKYKNFAFFHHPDRACLYDEAIKCIELNKDYPFIILRQVFIYFMKGIKNRVGLYETGIFVKNHKCDNRKFEETWWNEVIKHSRRDQISLVYAICKCQIKIGIIEGLIRVNIFSKFHKHLTKKYIFLSTGQSRPFSNRQKRVSLRMIKCLKKINSIR